MGAKDPQLSFYVIISDWPAAPLKMRYLSIYFNWFMKVGPLYATWKIKLLFQERLLNRLNFQIKHAQV